MKKYLIIILLLFVSMSNVLAFNTSKKIYDYAQILTEKEEKKLKKDIDLFMANSNMDMVLVTVKYHGKENTGAYATEFYDVNGFGFGEEKSGVVGVIDLSNKLVRFGFSKFGTANNIFSSEISKNIVDKTNQKEEKSYYKMFSTFVDETTEYFFEVKNIQTLDDSIIRILKIILISFIVTTLYSLILLLRSKNKKLKLVGQKNYLVKNSFELNKNTTKFITTQTKTIKDK